MPCLVYSKTKTEILCRIQPASQVSVLGAYVGQQGISRKFVDADAALAYGDLASMAGSPKLALQFETSYTEADTSGNLFQGWFTAPETTNYRFYMACDDFCRLNLGDTPNNISPVTRILDITSNQGNRDYWNPTDNMIRISDWVALTAGEKYYIEALHIEGSGADHLSVSVEIE